MTCSFLRLSGLSLVCAFTALRAQDPRLAPPSFPAGAVVRVEALTGERIEGRFEQYRGDSLLVSQAPRGFGAVPLGNVSRVWVQGRATSTGMLVGGLIGVPLGVLLGAGFCDFERNQENNIGEDVSCVEHYTVGTVATAALGVGLGALVGHFLPKWHLRFRLTRQDLRRGERPPDQRMQLTAASIAASPRYRS